MRSPGKVIFSETREAWVEVVAVAWWLKPARALIHHCVAPLSPILALSLLRTALRFGAKYRVLGYGDSQ